MPTSDSRRSSDLCRKHREPQDDGDRIPIGSENYSSLLENTANIEPGAQKTHV